MNQGSRIHTPNQRGFSLVEVLIAVLVLAIGLLGLGAVFPAIIAEQRESFEVIEGENAAGAAASMITSRELVDFRLMDDSFNKVQDLDSEQYTYDWVVPPFGGNFYGWTTSVPSYYDPGSQMSADFQGSATGLWSFNANRAAGDANMHPALTEIPMSARLYPQPYSGKDPRFVWDLVLRREPAGGRIQAAVFVRRVDARVRVPRDFSLSDVLTGNSTEIRLPVALDRNTGQLVADTGDMNHVYAAPLSLEVEVYEEHLDWLVFKVDPNIDTSLSYATRSGQKLLDNTGVVRTVVGAPQLTQQDESLLGSDRRAVIVNPPFAHANAGGNETDSVRPDQNTQNTTGYPSERAKRASWVRQVVFTPRTPVAIRVVTLEGTR